MAHTCEVQALLVWVDVDGGWDTVADLEHVHKADRFCTRSPYRHFFTILLELLQTLMPRSDTPFHFCREPIDQSRKVIDRNWRGLGVRVLGREATVYAEKLFFVGFLNPEDFEASSLEKVYEGFAAEVVAVFVDNIPNGKAFEDEPDVGDLEVDDCVFVAADSFADRGEKFEWVFNVFENVTTADKVARMVGVLFAVEILHVLDSICDRAIDSFPFVAGIEADSSILATFAEKREKVPFATAQFDNSFSANRIGLDEAIRQSLGISLKDRREVERVVILLRILEPTFIEGAIPNEAA